MVFGGDTRPFFLPSNFLSLADEFDLEDALIDSPVPIVSRVTLTLPPLISSSEGIISSLIISEALATIGSLCIDATAVSLASFAWYVTNWIISFH
jgi:hypothetical protein